MPARRLTVLFCLGLAVLMAVSVGMVAAVRTTAAQARIGGPFAMRDMTGRPVTEQDLFGRPSALYFGFTYCPEACPTTLLALTNAMRRMGRAADRLNVVFVTIDPERDTPDEMRLYLSNFDTRIRGFTGTDRQVARMAELYHIPFRRVPLPDGSYTMDHFAGVLLFDERGRYAGTIDYGSTDTAMADRLTALTETDACRSAASQGSDRLSDSGRTCAVGGGA